MIGGIGNDLSERNVYKCTWILLICQEQRKLQKKTFTKRFPTSQRISYCKATANDKRGENKFTILCQEGKITQKLCFLTARSATILFSDMIDISAAHTHEYCIFYSSFSHKLEKNMCKTFLNFLASLQT